MIAMRPILEPDVVYLLNDNRFEGDIKGYVVMDGPNYLGYALFRIDGTVTSVLEGGVENTMVLDGAVRACVAAGENAGATQFSVNKQDEKLAKWFEVFCKNEQMPVKNEVIFAHCD